MIGKLAFVGVAHSAGFSLDEITDEGPTFTFRVYQRSVKRRQGLSGAYLEAFDRALDGH